MRTVLLLLFLSLPVSCFADDPLESLNTVDDTVTIMTAALKAGAGQGDVDAEGSEAGGLPSASTAPSDASTQ